MTSKRFFAITLLLLAPVVAVQSVKQTDWGPVLAAPLARQKGNADAKVTIVEYSDFQCPSCATVEPFLHKIFDLYKGKVRLIYKYFPLVHNHLNAMPAAHAAECASEQNHFWPYHDRLFETQTRWAGLTNPTTSFMALAQEVKLDIPKFTACYADPSRIATIEKDAKEAVSRQVDATPTFFINDDRLVGQLFMAEGARAIEKAMRR